MAFHVACPITCRKICFCALGFPSKLHSDKGRREFLDEISRVEDFLKDPWTVRAGGRTTVQVPVPKIVVGAAATDGFGLGEGEEVPSVQNKRAALQKRAAAVSLAAEDYARRFETGNLEPQDVAGEAVAELTGDDHVISAIKVMCRLCFSGENEGSDRATRMLPCKICNKKYHRNCLKRWGAHRGFIYFIGVPGHVPRVASVRYAGELEIQISSCFAKGVMVLITATVNNLHTSDEKYLQFQADRNLQYKCAACRGDCYQVRDLDDSVQELWRRRDEADHDQIASLRAAAGLPSQDHAFSISPFSDDEENGPVIVKTNYGRSLKLSVKGFVEKTPKSNKEYGKKSTKGMPLKKKYAKKKGYQLSSTDKTGDQHQSFEKLYETQSLESSFGDARTDEMRSYRTEIPGGFSPDNTGNPGNTIEKSTISQPGNVSHKIAQEAVVHKNDRDSKVIHIKSRKSQGTDPGEATGEQAGKSGEYKSQQMANDGQSSF
ncbi:hypothetical protein ACLOJK_014974 [Asimina triloba]